MDFPESKTIEPAKPNNLLYWWLGLAILILNKIRHTIKGYKNPRHYAFEEYDRVIDYNFHVVNNWQKMLKTYTDSNFSYTGKSILELGPGDNLGTGLILLASGADSYTAFDINPLIDSCPSGFYEQLFKRIEKEIPTANIAELGNELDKLHKESGRLKYLCNKKLDLSKSNKAQFNLILSQAVFEHFENIDKVISNVSEAACSGATLIAEVDLMTHSRYIRSRDPLNIYRYPGWLYKLMKFSGIPNRIRPGEYAEILEKYGWWNIAIYPLSVVSDDYLSKTRIAKKFRNETIDMNSLSIFLCDTKKYHS